MLNKHTIPQPAHLQTQITSIQLPFIVNSTTSGRRFKYHREGLWNQKQRLKYAIFLIYFLDLIEDPIKQKRVKIYEMMSDMILTRSPKQCRNHHTKMMSYNGKSDNIINKIACGYQPTIFRQIMMKYLVFIKKLVYNKEKYIKIKRVDQQQNNIFQLSNKRDHHLIEQSEILEKQKYQTNPLFQKNLQSQLLKSQEQNQEDPNRTRILFNHHHHQYQSGKKIQQQSQIPIFPLKIQENIFNQQYYTKSQNKNNNRLNDRQNRIERRQQRLYKKQQKLIQQQINKIQLKLYWHRLNADQLSSQIIKQKQSIKYYQSTIKLINMTINIFSL